MNAPAATPLCELCDAPLWPPPSRADWRRCFACTVSPRHSRVRGIAPGYATPATATRMTFTVPGSPLSINRCHRMGVTKSGRRIMFYSPEGERYKHSVRCHALQARPAEWDTTLRYRVEVLSYFATDRSDADNPVKPLLDSLQAPRRGTSGILWDNDRQVVEVLARKAIDKSAPRLVVTVEVIP